MENMTLCKGGSDKRVQIDHVPLARIISDKETLTVHLHNSKWEFRWGIPLFKSVHSFVSTFSVYCKEADAALYNFRFNI